MSYCFGQERLVRAPRASDWSAHDIEQLCTLAGNGKTPADIAPIIGRTELATKRKGQQIGVFTKRFEFWLDSEITELRRLAKTHTYEQTAQAMGKTFASVAQKAKRLHISFQKYGEANLSTIYTKEDLKRLFEMRSQGFTLREIAEHTEMNLTHVFEILSYEVRYRDTIDMEPTP